MGEDDKNKFDVKGLIGLNSRYIDIYSSKYSEAFAAACNYFGDLHDVWKDIIYKLGKDYGISLGTLENLLIDESKESWERLRAVFYPDNIWAIPLVAQIAEYNVFIAEINRASTHSRQEPRHGRGSDIQEHVRILMQAPYEFAFLQPFWKARKHLMRDRKKFKKEIDEAFKELKGLCKKTKILLTDKFHIDYEQVKRRILNNPKSLDAYSINARVIPYIAEIFEFEALKAKRGCNPKKQELYETAITTLMRHYFNT